MFYKNFIKNQTPDIRHLFDMREVVFDQEWLEKQEDIELYYMYRGMGLSAEDKKKIEIARLRYDITIIPPLMLGKEFNKTAGHYHCEAATGISYPEIYEVLFGEAYYLMQHSIENNSIKDAYFVRAVAGDKIIIPPNYGHFTINASEKDLVMANWVCLDCISDYSEVKKKRGACYFALENFTKNPPSSLLQKGNIKWLPNKNYREISKLRELNPTNFSEFGLEKNKGMYKLVNDLNKLDFLVRPEEYKDLWERVLG
ncbi:MAG: glucose-6-phosphate isomerase family protein [Patescibacteria group bacterium]|nr:glucose-6-phosphate isomerase family protein [Patescibacteria group bacterium]